LKNCNSILFKRKSDYEEPILIEKHSDKILSAPLKLKLIKKNQLSLNLDTPLYQLLTPNPLTNVVSMVVMESALKLKSRRNFNIVLNEFEKLKNEEMPSDHSELMKKGGKCPVIHSQDEDDELKEEMGDCPFDHTQCKQQ
jgi:hypothetical protein